MFRNTEKKKSLHDMQIEILIKSTQYCLEAMDTINAVDPKDFISDGLICKNKLAAYYGNISLKLELRYSLTTTNTYYVDNKSNHKIYNPDKIKKSTCDILNLADFIENIAEEQYPCVDYTNVSRPEYDPSKAENCKKSRELLKLWGELEVILEDKKKNETRNEILKIFACILIVLSILFIPVISSIFVLIFSSPLVGSILLMASAAWFTFCVFQGMYNFTRSAEFITNIVEPRNNKVNDAVEPRNNKVNDAKFTQLKDLNDKLILKIYNKDNVKSEQLSLSK